ncbi:uncharacterized protein LOC141623082 [Silene latifolia]|uniref:uncharacterized protein LOC141623082 n=1 Tax=Silene latifolia TaxID=37657 RepID=UPI003D77830C
MPRLAVGTRQSKRGRASEPGVGEGSQGPTVLPVPEYPTVIFADFKQRDAFVELQKRRMKPTCFIDTTILEDLKVETDVRHIFETLGMTSLYRLRKHFYAFLTLEFMSSFTYDAVAKTVQFRFMNTSFLLTMDMFATHLGLAQPEKGALRDIPTECGASSYMPYFTGKSAPTSSNMLINDVQHITLKIFLRALTCLLYDRKDVSKLNSHEVMLLVAYLNPTRAPRVSYSAPAIVCASLALMATSGTRYLSCGAIATRLAERLTTFEASSALTPMAPSVPTLDCEYFLDQKWLRTLEGGGMAWRV